MSGLLSIQRQQDGKYLLFGRLDRDTVPSFWRTKEDWLPKDAKVVVDLSALERVDSAGMAMLLHFQQIIITEQKEIVFINMPSQLKTLMQLSSVENVLNG